jgi:hypothetical protein
MRLVDDMIFEQQPGPGLRPPCRSRFYRASATRRFGRSPTAESDSGTCLASGFSAATTRKAVFALRQCLDAAIADDRLQFNPATAVPLPTEHQSLRAICRRARLSARSTKCPLSIGRWCWSVRTPEFGGEKLRAYADAIATPMSLLSLAGPRAFGRSLSRRAAHEESAA